MAHTKNMQNYNLLIFIIWILYLAHPKGPKKCPTNICLGEELLWNIATTIIGI
jgi:hypothetical protein